jgi:hypothetical protein
MRGPSQLRKLGDESGKHALKSIPTRRDRSLARLEFTFDRENQIDRSVLKVPTTPVEAGANGTRPATPHPSSALPPTGHGLVVS